MTTDTMPSRLWAVTPPLPNRRPRKGRRAARVRPYHRYQEHHQNQPARVTGPAGPVGRVEPTRERAVLERVLARLRALGPRPVTPAAQATVQPAVSSTASRRPTSPSLALVPTVGNGAATGTDTPPALVVVPCGETPPAPPARESTVRSVLGCQLMPLVRAVLARRPEAAVPAARVEPSPDAIRTQPLNLVGVGS